MAPDGFPERGLGSWAQWKERRTEMCEAARDGTAEGIGMIGARCSPEHAVYPDDGCVDCNWAYVEWLAMNDERHLMSITLDEAGRRMAGLPAR